MNERAITAAARLAALPLMQMFNESADTHLGNIHNAIDVTITPLPNMTDALQRLAPLTRELTQCDYKEARQILQESISRAVDLLSNGERRVQEARRALHGDVPHKTGWLLGALEQYAQQRRAVNLVLRDYKTLLQNLREGAINAFKHTVRHLRLFF